MSPMIVLKGCFTCLPALPTVTVCTKVWKIPAMKRTPTSFPAACRVGKEVQTVTSEPLSSRSQNYEDTNLQPFSEPREFFAETPGWT